MPNYKLTYFDVAGYGQPIRYLLSIIGEQFQDVRLSREQWPSIKPTTPFGKVPVLEVDGKIAHQSTAICRYLGRKANLAGADDWEDLEIDMVIDTYFDLRQAITSYRLDQDEESRANKLKVLKDETFPFYFGKFDDLVKKNNGFLANGKLSWADVYFIATLAMLKIVVGYDYADHFQNLKRLRDHVLSLPQIKKWNESHASETA